MMQVMVGSAIADSFCASLPRLLQRMETLYFAEEIFVNTVLLNSPFCDRMDGTMFHLYTMAPSSDGTSHGTTWSARRLREEFDHRRAWFFVRKISHGDDAAKDVAEAIANRGWPFAADAVACTGEVAQA